MATLMVMESGESHFRECADSDHESKQLTFSNADSKAQTYKPLRSGLGLQLGGLSVAQKPLVNLVDALLEKLGLHIAQADVKVIEASCGAVGLLRWARSKPPRATSPQAASTTGCWRHCRPS